ncbi:uncharacterized protein LOC115621773 [Scaptodrosophila lebanonensis]|uniref:Uncharacterized protein LOC115621773 n=1 Tax=Drosophila lebanonensis TaxID=7225 RepID=A0A6J2T7Y8_DROLE|nr:uncharacterized protein LOC115621773 [Scaptodrosophila lebanonensis]
MNFTRVVVFVNDNKKSTGTVSEGLAEKEGRFGYGGELHLLDRTSLRLLCCQNASKPHVLLAKKLHFDSLVSSGAIDNTQTELSGLLHWMFTNQRDGLLLRLTPNRNCNFMFLMNALAVQVTEKLEELRLKLERGQVRYRQLVEEQTLPRCGCASRLETQFNFSHTGELFSWFVNEYRLRAGLATGHELVEVEYHVEQKEKNLKFCVKFGVVFVAMSDLGLEGLCALRSYFSNDVITAALARTALAKYLRHVTEDADRKPVVVLLLCHVLTTGAKIDAANVQLLGLAHLAYRQDKPGLEREESVRTATLASDHLPAYTSSMAPLTELNQLKHLEEENNANIITLQQCLEHCVQESHIMRSFIASNSIFQHCELDGDIQTVQTSLERCVQHAQLLELCRNKFEECFSNNVEMSRLMASPVLSQIIAKSFNSANRSNKLI